MQTKKRIEKHLGNAEKAYREGKYDIAKAELTLALRKIDEEVKSIKVGPQDKNLESLVNRFKTLSELRNQQKRARVLFETVKREKERSKKFQAVVQGLHKRKIINSMDKNQKIFEEFRDRERTINKETKFFKVLRRWNSYTPLLCLNSTENIGGGYFVALDGIGIVVDPGINFIRNALSAGLSIKDIDVIILTHSHVDHTADFEGIITLLHEVNDPRYDKNLDPFRIRLFASMGAVNKYCNLMSLSYDTFKEISVMNPGECYNLSKTLYFRTTPCQHNDLFCKHPSSCVGLKFYHTTEKKPIIAITSDTGCCPQLSEAFSDLKGNIVVLHIGGIDKNEVEFIPPPNVTLNKTHLGLRGILNFIFDVKPSVVIISEFGEEFSEDRTRISELIQQKFAGLTKVIPSDVGFTIEFVKGKPRALVACSKCGAKTPIEDISAKQERKGLNIAYLCPTCR